MYTKYWIKVILLVGLALVTLFLASGVSAQTAMPGKLSIEAGEQTNPDQHAAGLQGFHLISANEGWIVINQRLYWTKTGGKAWNNITPLDLGAAAIGAVSFIDTQSGWLVSVSMDGAGIAQHTLAQTSDGGVTWHTTPLVLFKPGDVEALAGAVYLQFIDAHTGWLVIKQATSSNFSAGTLFRTTDTGLTWTRLDLPIGERVYFVTDQVGWAAGGATGNEFYRTQDGGKTWQPLSVGSAPQADQQRYYQLPRFVNAQEGVLPVRVVNGTTSQVDFYLTADGGRSWNFAQSVPVDQVLAPNVDVPVALVDSQRWLMIAPHRNQLLELSAAGGLNTTARVLSQDSQLSGITQIDFVSEQLGWAQFAAGSCTAAVLPSNAASPQRSKQCSSETKLLRTEDGGLTWQTLSLPEAALGTDSQTSTLVVGQGFDKCEIASRGQMQDWWSNSPYLAVNLYFGGIQRGCSNTLLNSLYLSQLSQQGWLFIPTWVGPQAPGACGCSHLIDDDPMTAHNQGVSEANAAADAAANLGLGNAILYYDLEHYDNTNSTHRAAAQSFIAGWSAQLAARGNKSGVYGTGCNLIDFVSINPVLDAIWPAHWIYSSYNSNATVWNVACISNSLWSAHQRLRQYTGAHNETWGSTTLNIDSDVIDGLVARVTATPHLQSIGIFENGVFYLRNSNSSGPADITVPFGSSGMLPLAGDWNGDDIDTIGIYDAASGVFYLSNSNLTPAVNYSFVLGNPGDTPLAGRWDSTMSGAGAGVFRPSNGLIYVKRSLTSGYADFTMVLGNPGDRGIAGDWDGDGYASIGVFRPSNTTFYLSNTIRNGIVFGDFAFNYGMAAGKPVAGDWTGTGFARVGVFAGGVFYLRNTLSAGPMDNTFVYGSANALPIAGRWTSGALPPPNNLFPTNSPAVQATATPNAVPTRSADQFD